MNLNRKMILYVLISMLIAWGILYVKHYFVRDDLDQFNYATVDAMAKAVAVIASLICLCVFLMLNQSMRGNGSKNIRSGVITFFAVLAFSIGTVLVANPDGLFPWGDPPYYLRVAGRTIKPRMYLEYPDKPIDVIILGSSRAFTLPTEPIAEKWDVNVLNMSVEAANAIDFYVMTETVNRVQDPVRLIIAEVGQPVVANNSWKTSPLTYVSFLPLDKSVPITWNALRSTFTLSALTDSLYLLTFPNNQPPYITFNSSGYSNREPVEQTIYEENLREGDLIFRRLRCNSLDKVGVEYLSKVVAQASADGTSIIFYRSPLNADFVESINVNNPAYARCDQLITGFFEELASKNPNVFFRDLAYYGRVAELGRLGFTDVWHLTSDAADMVIKALEPEIQAALDWTEIIRER